MICISDNFTKNLLTDRCFLKLSSTLAEPFCKAWHLLNYRLIAPLDSLNFENDPSRMLEITKRIAIVVAGIFTTYLAIKKPKAILTTLASLGFASRAFRFLGFSLQKNGYTHVLGKAQEITIAQQESKISIMSWNICGLGGGLSLDHGGVIDYRFRLDGIVQKIKEQNPDVLILQEVYDTALAEMFIDKLQNDFAHFFIHLGPNPFGSVGGCMILSKCALHKFSYTCFDNNHWSLNRGFATLEIKKSAYDPTSFIRIIGTHLIHGDSLESQQKRQQQIAQILQFLANQTLALPTVLAGDLNIERDSSDGTLLSNCLTHGYSGSASTCTNRLIAKWKKCESSVEEELIDYISLFKRIKYLGHDLAVVDKGVTFDLCHLIQAFDRSYNTKTALSDHHGVFALLKTN